jgi:hypothetical protein
MDCRPGRSISTRNKHRPRRAATALPSPQTRCVISLDSRGGWEGAATVSPEAERHGPSQAVFRGRNWLGTTSHRPPIGAGLIASGRLAR